LLEPEEVDTSFTISPDKMKWFCDEAAAWGELRIKYAIPASHSEKNSRKVYGGRYSTYFEEILGENIQEENPGKLFIQGIECLL
jgi:hypothetical protein